MKFLRLLSFSLVLLVCTQAWSSTTERVLTLASNHKVVYKYSPAESGKPTIVLLNGLIYPLKYWNEYYRLMSLKGYGVIQIAYSTQPESIRRLSETPYFMNTNISMDDMGDEVMAVVDSLKIKKFHLFTLSYGSIPGVNLANRYASRIESLILVAPAIMPTNLYQPYGQSRHQYYIWLKAVNMNPLIDPEQLYDLEMFQAMRMILEPQKSTYDLKDINFETFFHGVYQMARSTKWFDLKKEITAKWPRTTMVLASQEESMLAADQVRAWDILRKTSPRDSVAITVDSAPHAIPGVFPEAMKTITERIIHNDLEPGEYTFEVDPGTWNGAELKPPRESGSSSSSGN